MGPAALILLTATTAFGPHLFRPFFERLRSWFLDKRNAPPGGRMAMPDHWTSIFGMAVYVTNYLLLGVVTSLIGHLSFDQPIVNVLVLGCAFSFAWIAGFFSPGSPAGLGVREFLLVRLLAPCHCTGVATGITTLLRVVTLSGDGLACLVGAGLMKKAAATPG